MEENQENPDTNGQAEAKPKKQYGRSNDAFFVKKRKIFREGEQLGKQHNCEVFIFVHNKESDKIF
jgi:hypothetical protein